MAIRQNFLALLMERLSTNHFIYYISKLPLFFSFYQAKTRVINLLYFTSVPVRKRVHLSEVHNWGIIKRKVDHDIKTVLFLDVTSCILVDNTNI
jgi:hypothetical protein